VPTTKEVAMIEHKEQSKEDVAYRAYELYVHRAAGSLEMMSRTGSELKKS
jgi:phage anti-repressor protein